MGYAIVEGLFWANASDKAESKQYDARKMGL
jgi:hypothetical protein